MLEATGRQGLRADENAQKRRAWLAHRLNQRLDHAGDAVEPAPAVGEGADARQHDMLGGEQVLGPRDDVDFAAHSVVPRGALERLLRRAQIARAVVDDGDGHRASALEYDAIS